MQASGERRAQAGLVRAAEAILHGENESRDAREALPAAVDVTDAARTTPCFNAAAALLWGHLPRIGHNGRLKRFSPAPRLSP